MKTSYIASTNTKGQIVIPKLLRDILSITPETSLNITCSGEGIYLYPIEAVVTKAERNSGNTYLSLLKITKGAWRNEDWEKVNSKRKNIEIADSKKRKQTW